MKTILLPLMLMAVVLLGCGNTPARTAAAQPTPTPTVTPAAGKYTCPMHPDVVSDKPGKCPKCGMKLQPAK